MISWIVLHAYKHPPPKYLPCLKFFSTQRMSDIFNGVTQAVGVVIGWVNAPLVFAVWMRSEFDTISYRVLFAVFHCQFHTQSGLSMGNT